MAKKQKKERPIIKNPSGMVIIEKDGDELVVTKKAFEVIYKNKGYKFIEDAPDPDDLDEEVEDFEPVKAPAKGTKRKTQNVESE